MLIVDTNVFVAATDVADPNHPACAALVETHPGPLVTIATLDHCDSRFVRPAHIDAFELIPTEAP